MPYSLMRLSVFISPLLMMIMIALVGCDATASQTGSHTTELTIFAAASLTDAFTELAESFESQHPDTVIRFNFAGSSQLAAQLSEGATADIFASASPQQIERVVMAGRAEANAPIPFAANQLVLITPTDNPAAITGLGDLERENLILVTAVPEVPIRLYTDLLIAQQSAALQTAFYTNIVSEEDNVRQIVAKVTLGEADAAIVYRSDLTSQVEQIPLRTDFPILYPMVILADAPHSELAQAFADFVLSPDGQTILHRWGFSPPPAE